LIAIKNAGGIAIVQDPSDASFPDMPRNALAAVDADYCLSKTKSEIAKPANASTGMNIDTQEIGMAVAASL
jgi:chemotaxis response regulator CheB